MTAAQIIAELKPLGSDGYKKVLMNHGIKEPFYGVKIEDMKKVQKKVKKDYQLALELYDTGVYDWMYLAGLIADDPKMTKKDLQRWVEQANSPGIAEYTVPWVAAESPHGWELGLKWIDSRKENIMCAGWQTLAGLAALKPDEELDLDEYKRLLQRVEKTIHQAPNRVRYVMNSFVIAVGSGIKPLSSAAVATAKKIGAVDVEMVGDCKLPNAVEYIKKVADRGAVGKKRKTVKC